jgi:hypothetical protein
MARKKKKGPTLDDYEWDEMPDADMAGADGGEVERIALRDFCIPEKAEAFCHTYRPASEDTPGAEAFDDARLRLVFKAQVCGLGDPLAIYMGMLKAEGFRMEMSRVTGEPCIYAVRRRP